MIRFKSYMSVNDFFFNELIQYNNNLIYGRRVVAFNTAATVVFSTPEVVTFCTPTMAS